MKLKHSPPRFTAVEAITLGTVAGILALILTPVFASVKSDADRVACVTNLRQIGGALHHYALENEGRLPHFSGGTWAWDVPPETMITMITIMRDGNPFSESVWSYNGPEKDPFYCPSNDPAAIEIKKHLSAGGGVTTDYVIMLARNQAMSRTETNDSVMPGLRTEFSDGRGSAWIRVREPMSQRPLAADTVFGTPPYTRPTSFLADEADGGWRSNHVAPGTVTPLGGNILFLDGHVAWRPFSEMKQRGMPDFWW